ncbi:MAG: BTAD domain-containing putative transcriptional regulator, partial [Dermatophilaceae bacterium]
MKHAPSGEPVSTCVQLLGRPRISGAGTYQLRSRKSWSVLAYLLLGERPPTRSQLAGLLFAQADDPGRALRWSLNEIRRALGPGTVLEGDPVLLRVPDATVIDVRVLTRGAWIDAVGLPGLGADLLEGVTLQGAPGYDTWLLSQQRHLNAVSEAILHEAALGSMSIGELQTALGYAVRLVGMNPLDENHQALLIRLYRLLGDDPAAQRQLDACVELFDRELGVPPGIAIEAATRESRYERLQT